MMGWIAFIGIGAVIAVALIALGVPRLVWTSVGAALMVAATGYVVQGSPDLAGKPATPTAESVRIPEEDMQLRDAMFGGYHNGTPYLAAADALLRAGDPRSAANAALGGVRKFPGNAALWTELGTAASASDGGAVSPAALFALQRAMRLLPNHPGPHYFLGICYANAGQLQAARAEWVRAYELSPPTAPYRETIGERVRLLDQFMAMASQARGQAGGQAQGQPAP